MKYIKQNAKRALSWLTTLTLTLAIVPVFTEPALAVSKRIERDTITVFDNTTLAENKLDEEGWAWYTDGITVDGIAYTGFVLVLDGFDLVATNTGTSSFTLSSNLNSVTIVTVEGSTNSIEATASGPASLTASSLNGGITITGKGLLTLTSRSRGLATSGSNLTIKDTTVNIAGSEGIFAAQTGGGPSFIPNGTVTIINSTVDISASGNSRGINCAANSITITDSNFTVSGGSGAFSHQPIITFTDTNAEITAWWNTVATPSTGWGVDSYTFDASHRYVRIVQGTWGRMAGSDVINSTQEPDNTRDVDVQARIVDINVSVYRIDISWGNMKFVFDINSAAWDYEDREYTVSQASWLIDNGEEEGNLEGYLDGKNNKVTVTNRSNNGINVGFDFELETPNLFNGDDNDDDKVQGNFFRNNGDAVTAAAFLTDKAMGGISGLATHLDATIPIESADITDHGIIETLPSRDVFFAFSGTPDKGTSDNFQKAGIITVTIEPNNN